MTSRETVSRLTGDVERLRSALAIAEAAAAASGGDLKEHRQKVDRLERELTQERDAARAAERQTVDHERRVAASDAQKAELERVAAASATRVRRAGAARRGCRAPIGGGLCAASRR